MTETALLSTLRDYRKQLEDHLTVLRDRHAHLESAWVRLRDVYEGEGAQTFAEAFEVASRRLDDYTNSGAQIARQLQGKLDELLRFEAGRAEL